MVKEIPLQNGMVALVDDEDFERINQYNWWAAQQNGKKSISVQRDAGNKECALLGREILGVYDSDMHVIRMGEDLDYRKQNLRVVPKELASVLKSRSTKGSTSKYRGVSWNKRLEKWMVRIKGKYIGTFEDEDEAARVWNMHAKKEWGELAYQNEVGVDSRNPLINIEKDKTNQHRSCKDRKRKYRGVSKVRDGVYQVQAYKQNIRYNVGCFDSEVDAAKAYDQKVYELYNDKAILNFPELIEEYKKAAPN